LWTAGPGVDPMGDAAPCRRVPVPLRADVLARGGSYRSRPRRLDVMNQTEEQLHACQI
jgi:hypothetical protein